MNRACSKDDTIQSEACKSEIESISNTLKITSLSESQNLTIDKINTRFSFAKNNIIGIDINRNIAILKFDSAEGLCLRLFMVLHYNLLKV